MRTVWVSFLVGLSCVSFGQDLGVGRMGLPDGFVRTVEQLTGKGLPDIREAIFCRFVVEQFGRTGAGFEPEKKIGWVFPVDELGVQMGITIQGAPVSVGKVLGRAEYPDRVDRTSSSFVRGAVTFDPWLSSAFLYMAGRYELAIDTFQAGYLSDKTFEESLMYPFYSASAGEALKGYYSSDFEAARYWVNWMKATIRPMPANRDLMFWRNQSLPDQLMAELDRREGRVFKGLDEIRKLPDHERRLALIDLLDMSGAKRRDGHFLIDIESEISREGDAMVPYLIEAYRTDERLSQQARFTFSSYLVVEPETVRERILWCMRLIWAGFSLPDHLGRGATVAETAGWIEQEWGSAKHLSHAERCLMIVTSEKHVGAEIWNALSRLMLERGEYRDGGFVALQPPLFQTLDMSQKDQLGRTLKHRIDVALADESERLVGESGTLILPMAYARIAGRGAVPMLDLYMERILEVARDGSSGASFQLDEAVGTITAQRFALGDFEGAIADYRSYLEMRLGGDFPRDGLYRPAWEAPDYQPVQDLVVRMMKAAAEEYMEQHSSSRGVDNPLVGFLGRAEAYQSPGIRRVIVDLIRDDSVYGVVTFRDPVRSPFRPYGDRRILSRIQQDLAPPEGAVEITVGDYATYQLMRQSDSQRFKLYKSSLERRKQRERLIRMIEDGAILSLFPAVGRRHPSLDQTIYVPAGL